MWIDYFSPHIKTMRSRVNMQLSLQTIPILFDKYQDVSFPRRMLCNLEFH